MGRLLATALAAASSFVVLVAVAAHRQPHVLHFRQDPDRYLTQEGCIYERKAQGVLNSTVLLDCYLCGTLYVCYEAP